MSTTRSGALAQRAGVPVVLPALPAALERGLVDQVSVPGPNVLAVVAPLRRLEAAAVGVLLDGVEHTALGLGERGPPAVTRRLHVERALVAQRLARALSGRLVLHERERHGMARAQRVLDDEEVVTRHALAQRGLERVADGGAAGAEERGAEQAEREDRAGARRLALVDGHRAETPHVGAGSQQREMLARDAGRRQALYGALGGGA